MGTQKYWHGLDISCSQPANHSVYKGNPYVALKAKGRRERMRHRWRGKSHERMKHKRQVWERIIALAMRMENYYRTPESGKFTQESGCVNVCSKAVCLYRSVDRPFRGQTRTQACFCHIRASEGVISAGTWIQILRTVLVFYQHVLRPVRWSSPTTTLHLWEKEKSRKEILHYSKNNNNKNGIKNLTENNLKQLLVKHEIKSHNKNPSNILSSVKCF